MLLLETRASWSHAPFAFRLSTDPAPLELAVVIPLASKGRRAVARQVLPAWRAACASLVRHRPLMHGCLQRYLMQPILSRGCECVGR